MNFKRLLTIVVPGTILLSCFLFISAVNDENSRDNVPGNVKLKPAAPGKRTPKKYSWESNQARAVETGNLEWTPKPFAFEAGKSIRYIDYENGDDNNNGKSNTTPWKHHPWVA